MTAGPYRRFLVAATISLYGDQLTSVALLVLLYKLTGSVEAPAGFLLAKQVPRLVGSFPGGALADRLGPHLVVAACALVQGAVLVAIIVAARQRAPAAVFTLVAVGQLAAGMSRAALQAVLPRVVESSRLARANALLQLSGNSSFIVAPALAAPLIAWKGPELLLAIDAVSFLISATIMGTLRTVVEAPPPAALATRHGALSGLHAVLATAILRVLVATHFAEGLAVSAASGVFVFLAEQRLGGDGNVGLLYAAVGVGDAVGSLLVLRLHPAHITPVMLLVPGLVSVGSVGFVAVTNALWSAGLWLILCGGAAIVFQTWGISEAQRITDREMMGRVAAVVVMAQTAGLLTGATALLGLLTVMRWDAALGLCCVAATVLLAVVGFPSAVAGRRPAVRA